MKGRKFMTIDEFNSIITKYGKDKILGIVFDNMRVWSLVVPKRDETNPTYPMKDEDGNKVFYSFDELVTVDSETNSIVIREYQAGTSAQGRNRLQWDIVTPVENIQGFRFAPANFTEEQVRYLKEKWDPTVD